jgi:hypothetical protein
MMGLVAEPGIFTWGAEYCCQAEEGGGLKGDLELRRRDKAEEREGGVEGRMDERNTRLGFRKINLLAYRNFLRVKFFDLKKSSNVLSYFFRRGLLDFKKKRNPNIFRDGAFCKKRISYVCVSVCVWLFLTRSCIYLHCVCILMS